MPKQYSIDEMQAQIRQLETTMQLPGVPADEKAIYSATIQRIRSEIAAQQAKPVTPEPPKQPLQPIKTTTPPPTPAIIINTNTDQSDLGTDLKPTTPPPPLGGEGGGLKPRVIHPPGAQTTVTPNNATIEIEHDTDPHNPRLTIRWADGYSITVDETAARGRFTTTFRDTLALRCISKEHRYDRMWRWDTPWRAAGFYQALTHFYNGEPTLAQLGIQRPGELAKTIFSLITKKAMQPISSNGQSS